MLEEEWAARSAGVTSAPSVVNLSVPPDVTTAMSTTHTLPAATGYPAARRIAVLLSVLFGVAMAWIQTSTGYGQDQSAFSRDSDALLRVASYAFSIWGLVYLSLLVHGVWQALPRTAESGFLRLMGWPTVLALIGIGLWIPAAAFDQELATIVLIIGSAAALILPLSAVNACRLERRDYWLAATPLGLLAGWLTVASAANVIVVASGNGWLPDGPPAMTWPMAAVGLVALVAAAVTLKTRLLAYPLPIVWGLVAIYMAEQTRHPTLAFTALGVAIGLAGLAMVSCFGLKRPRA